MSVAIDSGAESKAKYDSEFAEAPTVGDEDEVDEEKTHHRDGCAFTCSPFSTF